MTEAQIRKVRFTRLIGFSAAGRIVDIIDIEHGKFRRQYTPRRAKKRMMRGYGTEKIVGVQRHDFYAMAQRRV